MREETKKVFNEAIRKEFEPCYKRRLTQEEVDEIGSDLVEYFGLLYEIHARLEREKASKGK